MPGVNNKMEIALLPDITLQGPSQPRQPENLQGLLRFAMDARSESDDPEFAPAPLDNERKTFLENALNSMTVNVIEVMQKQIEILKKVTENLADDQVEETLQAFSTLTDLIENIDFARDYHKVGGFAVFNECLGCSQGKIRAATCGLIAELAQNNPYIQKAVCEENLMPKLLSMLHTDQDESVQIKALYAISCVTRDFTEGYNLFIENDGVNVLKNVILTDNDKLRTKVTFMLSSLHRLDTTLLECLVTAGFLPILVKFLDGNWRSSNEHVLALLTLLVENVPEAKKEIIRPELCFERIIQQYLHSVRDKEEFRDEERYCNKLKAMTLIN